MVKYANLIVGEIELGDIFVVQRLIVGVLIESLHGVADVLYFVVAHVEADGVGAGGEDELAGEPGEVLVGAVHMCLLVVGVEAALAGVNTLLKLTVQIPVADILVEKLITSSLCIICATLDVFRDESSNLIIGRFCFTHDHLF